MAPSNDEHQDQQTNDATTDVNAEDQEQQAEIAAMFDDEPADTSTAEPADDSKERAGDKPADQPADGQAADKDKPAKDDDAQPPDDKGGQELGDKGQPADASAEQQPPVDTKDDPLKATYKVVTPEGARDVPAADLITTYQQFNNLQRQHLHVKPLLDFAKSNDMPMDLVWPIFAKGYATLQEEHARGEAGGQPESSRGGQDDYQGPYKDAEQEKYYAERDPDMHQIIMNQHKVMMDLNSRVRQLARRPSAPIRPSQVSDPQSVEDQRQEIRTQFRKKVTDWAGQHKDYFGIDEKGESKVLDAFLIYMGTNYPSWRVSELNEQQMSIAFSGFDPAYYTSFITEQAKSKEEEIRQQDRQTFAESNNVRTQAPKLGEQEQEISDLWDAMV